MKTKYPFDDCSPILFQKPVLLSYNRKLIDTLATNVSMEQFSLVTLKDIKNLNMKVFDTLVTNASIQLLCLVD